jgi:hypothetical protein
VERFIQLGERQHFCVLHKFVAGPVCRPG